jgi:5-methylcytosine-specific restriction endonuclease McrA
LRNPYCITAGCNQPATEVDHIVPRRDRPDLAFEESNCRALCKSHHSARTAREQSWHRIDEGKGT